MRPPLEAARLCSGAPTPDHGTACFGLPQVRSRRPDRLMDQQSCDFEKGRNVGFSEGGYNYPAIAAVSGAFTPAAPENPAAGDRGSRATGWRGTGFLPSSD